MNTRNITNKQSACPACEYERCTSGRPVREDGLMKCLDCGSSWREMGNSLDHILKDTAYEAKSQEYLTPNSIYHDDDEPIQNTSIFSTASQRPHGTSSIGRSSILMALAGLLFISVLFMTLFALPQASQSNQAGQLKIANVDVREQVRPQGDKVFTVKGTVQNHSAHQERIPRITIILRQTNGREVVRWNYNSTKKTIYPGKKFTFASSIQYDTPYVAYAEASFN